MTTAAFLSVLIHLWTRLVLSDQSSSLLLCSSSLQLLFSVHVNFRSPFIFPHDIQGNIAVFLQNLDSFILRTASPSQKSLHIFHQKPLNLPPKKNSFEFLFNRLPILPHHLNNSSYALKRGTVEYPRCHALNSMK